MTSLLPKALAATPSQTTDAGPVAVIKARIKNLEATMTPNGGFESRSLQTKTKKRQLVFSAGI
jgi:hypothetical protein